MKTFAEAINIFAREEQEAPAKNLQEATQRAIRQALLIRNKYGHLDDEIRGCDLAQRMMLAYVQTYTNILEQDEVQPNEVLLSLAFSCFRHGMIVGIEMEKHELDEEGNTKQEPITDIKEGRAMRSVFGGGKTTKGDYVPEEKRGDFPCTSRQVKKLLTMLSMADLIDSWFEDRERVWDEDAAVHWVRQTIGVKVQELSGLTQKQIGRCFEELGE